METNNTMVPNTWIKITGTCLIFKVLKSSKKTRFSMALLRNEGTEKQLHQENKCKNSVRTSFIFLQVRYSLKQHV